MHTLITQRPIVEAMSEGGADQLSPCQALPKTINPTILHDANPPRRAGRVYQEGPGATWVRRVIEGNWVGCDQFCIVYLHAAGQAHKASELITEAIWIPHDLHQSWEQ